MPPSQSRLGERSAIAEIPREVVVALLIRHGVDCPGYLRHELRDEGLAVQLDADGGVLLLPADIYPAGPDCFGRLAPHPECVGRTSCPRARACSE